MRSYDMLPDLLQILLMFSLFLHLCVSAYLLYATFHRKSLRTSIPALLCALLSGGIMILYSADVRSSKHGYPLSPLSRWLCEKPIVLPVVLLVLMTVYLVYACRRELALRRTTVSPSAIKESIDHLNTGLCFYAENGRVMLVNHCMNRLCHILLGRDLQNAALMWDTICSGELQPGVIRHNMGSQPSFTLPDGTVWSFCRTQLNGVLQITAADTTDFHRLVEELEQKNTALAALQQRLKQYELDVEELSRARERLETKSRIHGDLGQTLTASRRYLQDAQTRRTVPVDAWRQSIAWLRQKLRDAEEGISLETLVKTAGSYGVAVEVEGVMPRQERAAQLFLEAGAEALTNAVRHAGARRLSICFTETETHTQVCFRNDGTAPSGPVTEGGGLGALRRKVETAGGTMTVSARPEFLLAITMRKDGGESV